MRNTIGSAMVFTLVGLTGCGALAWILRYGENIPGQAIGITGFVAAMIIPGVFKLLDRGVQLRVDASGIHNPAWPVKTIPWSEVEEIASILIERRPGDPASTPSRMLACVMLREHSSVLNVDGIKAFAASEDELRAIKLDNMHWDISYDELVAALTELRAVYA